MKKGNVTISSIFKGSKTIEKILKGTITIYEAFKKLIASGVPPITLLKCKSANLVDYKVYGDSKQESKNLWTYGDLVGTGQATINDCVFEPGTYTISCNVSSNDTKANTCQIVATDTNNEIVLNIQMERINNSTKTFTLTKPTTRFIFRSSSGYVSGSTVEFSFTNIQIEKGSVATEYVPPIPTTNNPIEIESVGDKTKNYLDINHLGNISNWDTAPTYASYEITLPNGNYYFKYETDLETYDKHILILNKNKSSSANYVATFINGRYGVQSKEGTFTISDNEKIYLNWYCETGKKQANLTAVINDVLHNFIIEPGDTFTGYEPYGYKIPVKVSGKNLFKTTNYEQGSLNVSDGSVNKNHVISFIETTDFIPLKAGTYTVSYKTGANLRYIAYYNENKEIVGNVWSGRANPFKFTLDKDYLVRIDVERDGNVTIDNFDTFFTDYEIQLEKGTTVTTYTPYIEPTTTNIYLNEPLRKIGDYVDYIDFENKKVVRKIKEKILTNSDKLSAIGRGIVFTESVDIVKPSSTTTLPTILCSHYSKTAWAYTMPDSATKEGVCINSSANLIGFYDSVYANSLETFKTFLDNNELKLYYGLAISIEEDITLPNIPLNKGTNIIEVDTSILPSNMEVTYYSKDKPTNEPDVLNETDNIVLNGILGTDTETEIDISDTEINQILDEIIGG